METTNDQILQELKELREDKGKRASAFSIIDKVVLSVVTTCILGLFGFVWDMNVRMSLVEQKIENNIALESVQKLELKLEELSDQVTDLRILLESKTDAK